MKNIRQKIKYPKFIILVLTIIIAVCLFQSGNTYKPFHDFILSLGLFGDFVGGFFYAYGLTAAPATSILLLLAKEQNILVAGLIAGLGALISDILIFLFIRYSFSDEINRLKKENLVVSIKNNGKKIFGSFYNYLLPSIAGFIIASPLPTEIGVSLLASLKKISILKFMVIAYLLHTIGILIILIIGNAI